MQTHTGTGERSQRVEPDVMMTTDIDFTADLGEPPATPTTNFQRPSAPAPRATPRPRTREPVLHLAQSSTAPEPSARLPIAPGRVLRDRYVLTQIIGMGGMCTVFRARDLEALPNTGRPAFVAVKTPRPDYHDQARAIERLKREFEHAQRLSHSGIVQVFELANDGDVWFMTMELIEGESLASIIRKTGAAIAPYLARRVVRGIGDALAYAHATGVAHGDLNPANVLVLGGERIRLIDFAAACRNGEQPSAAATLAYASPQVIEGQAPEPRDDIFSFACIAYEIVTGRHPFEQRPATVARAEGIQPETPSKLTSEQSSALMSALSFDRETRPSDIKALALMLAPQPQRVRTIDFEIDLEPPPPDEHSEKRWLMFAAACVVVLVGAVIFSRLG